MRDGFVKVAAAVPEIRVADCAYNAEQIVEFMRCGAERGVKVMTFSELCVTGCTCGDLFRQEVLISGAEEALSHILEATRGLDLLAAVGLPVRYRGRLYSCAAVILKGAILGLVPKCQVSAAEGRWFSPASEQAHSVTVTLAGQAVPFGVRQYFTCTNVPNLVVGVEVCDLCGRGGALSREAAEQGATLLLNPAASPEIAGQGAIRRRTAESRSAELESALVYASSGEGESTTDFVFGGHALIAENGVTLAQRRFEAGLTVSEIDVELLSARRLRAASVSSTEEGFETTEFTLRVEETKLTRPVSENPFLPADGEREELFDEILAIAALGLKKRISHTGARCAVIGLSGGLDSTLAVLTAARAMDMLGRSRKDIIAVTMPCFGTTARTRSNAELLAEELGAELRVVDISAAVRQHFEDIGQSMDDHSVTFENGQARERTQVLMDLANRMGGMVIGTGDLSELALGWCTYNGDQMSMYSVNGGIPKTLMRHLVAWEAKQAGGRLADVLRDILDTPVSPELLPPKNGEIAQRTEDLVGPYELHDFFIYYALFRGFRPRKVLRLAEYALAGRWERAELLKWLSSFYRRFFAQQFKRSCMPDGPSVGPLSLSPRGGLVMPSDAVAALWMKEVEGLDQ